MIAPRPTAPIGAASPIWPTTPVSTAPRMGIVTFDSTMGSAIPRTRPFVTSRGASAVSVIARHQEMRRRLSKGSVAIVLPRDRLHRCIAPPGAGDRGPRIGVARQARAQVIDGEVNRLGQARQVSGGQRLDIEGAAFEIFPDISPAE